MAKVRQILSLYAQGISKKKISEQTGASRNTVKKYLRIYHREQLAWSDIEQMNDYALTVRFCPDEYREPCKKAQTLMALFPEIEKKLKRRGVTRTHLWKEYLQNHSDGYRFTSFCFYLDRWLNHSKPVMHIEHKAGDKLFIDFAGEKMHIIDKNTGEQIDVEVFAAILGCSQLTYVEAVASQTKEDLITACENAMHYIGGVPAAIVPDNLKSAVTKASKYEPKLNETFEDFANHYSTTVLPARSYRPKDKALVEGIVKIIYQRVYVSLDDQHFFSLEELNTAIKTALEVHNNQLLTGRDYSRRQQFEEIEKATLRPLPQYRYELKKQYSATVMKNGHVSLAADKHYYSVPYRFIGKKLKLIYNSTLVEIYYDYEKIASHPRDMRPHKYTSVTEHLASNHQFVTEWSAEKFIADGKKIHDDVALYLAGVIETKTHPEAAYKSCMGILHFARKVGNERLANACRRAHRCGLFGYPHIENILHRKLDMLPEEEENTAPVPHHPNIRGNHYYQ